MAIPSYGRTTGSFVSALEFQELERLRAFERRAYRIDELPAAVADAMSRATMDPKHDHLDLLIDKK